MKKTFLSGLLLFVAAVTLSGCSKDETTDPATTAQTTISATVEEPTRTALDGASVKWVAGDKILLANTGTATAEYTLKTIEGGEPQAPSRVKIWVRARNLPSTLTMQRQRAPAASSRSRCLPHKRMATSLLGTVPTR